MEANHARRPGRFSRLELIPLGVAVLLLIAFTVPNLGNFPVPSDDEIWILSASHKLANEGVFGSDLFRDYYRAHEVYLFNMPAHHFVLAGVFKLAGTGILEGRLLSVFYGVLTLGLAYALARQVYGIATAVLTLALLLFLRLNLGFDTGLPLQEMARSIRYDLAPVPLMLGGALLLLKPTLVRTIAAGSLFSLAMLMQFYGALMIPVGIAYLLAESRPLRERVKLAAVLAAAAIIVALPYGVYVLTNYYEFEGQSSTLYRRIELADPTFYIENVLNEPERFRLDFGSPRAALTKQPSAKLALFAGLPLAGVFVAVRAFRTRARGDRLLFLSLVGLTAGMAVLEAQKIEFYWIAVVPFLALAIAAACVAALAGMPWQRPITAFRLSWRRLIPAGVALLFLGVVAIEGTYAQLQGFRSMGSAATYLDLREELAAYVPPGSRVVGATSLWWAMPRTEFRSYYLLFYRTNPRTTDDLTSVGGYLDGFGAEYIVLNRISRIFLERLVVDDRDELGEYLTQRGELLANFEHASYGWIEVWKILPARESIR